MNRPLLATLALAAVVAVGIVLPIAPASADTADVTTLAELQAALNEGGHVTLGGDILTTSTIEVTRPQTTLDLNGYALSSSTVRVAENSGLIIADTDRDGDAATSGSLTATGGGAHGSGIELSNSALWISAGSVTATGGDYAAGIGYSGATSVRASDASEFTMTGGTVTAVGGAGAAGIGGGAGQRGLPTSIYSGTVTARSGPNDVYTGVGAAIGAGGSATMSSLVVIDAGASVTVGTVDGRPRGTFSTAIGSGGTDLGGALELQLFGTLSLEPGEALRTSGLDYVVIGSQGVLDARGATVAGRTVRNDGTILADTSSSITAPVSGHNYDIAFETHAPGATSPTIGRVYASSLGAALIPLPGASLAGWVLDSWNSALNGTGAMLTPTTTLTADQTFWAVWVREPLTLGSSNATPAAGTSADFTATTDSADHTETVAFSSSEPTDVVTGTRVAFSRAGERTISATYTGDSAPSGSMTITVAPAATERLLLSPSTTAVTAGGSVHFVASDIDRHGNATVATSGTAFSVDGKSVTSAGTIVFTVAGRHTVTATREGLSATATVDVSPAATVSLVVKRVGYAPTVGAQAVFTATGSDRFGNATGDVTRGATFASTGAGDVANAYRGIVWIGSSATRTITVTLDGAVPAVTGSLDVTVPTLAFPLAPVPTITGAATTGSRLTAVPATWAPKGATLAYQWKRGGVAIPGATGKTYRLTSADVAKKITVSVTGTKTDYTATTKTSASVTGAKGTLTGTTPKITGTKKLTAVAGAWTGALSYQWSRNGKPISGATKASYSTTAADKGTTIRVVVTATKTGYTTLTKTSAGMRIAK